MVVAALAILAPSVLTFTAYRIIAPYKQYIVSRSTAQHIHIGMVLGAGVSKDGKPYKELQARLDSAAEALRQGKVDKLLLSGDNRYSYYDEPDAMRRYLIGRGISADKLAPDYAGRSTYESCERATKVFKLKQVMLFSASSHLSRAIYICRHFGIDTYGISSGVEANNSTRRELLARVKAIYNVELIGEPTILGPAIDLH